MAKLDPCELNPGHPQSVQHARMPTNLQYWSGTIALSMLAMTAPVWLLFNEMRFEAAIIGLPSIGLLIWFVVATMKLRRTD